MRRSPVALTLVAVALTAAACGGSGKSSDSSTNAGTEASASGSSSDALGVLSSIDRTVGTSPQRVKLDVNLDIKGTPSDAQLALFTKKPIQISLDGVVDAGTAGGDMNLNVSLGDTPVTAEFRYRPGKTWLQIDGKWYEMPASTLSSVTGTSLPSGTSASSFDVNKLIASMGDMTKVFKNATVSDDSVEGIDSDKVSADIDLPELGKLTAKGVDALNTGTGATVTPGELESMIAGADKVIKNAHVEMWVGKDDHKIHRATITGDAVLDDSTKASSGIESVSVKIDSTTTESEAPDLSEPDSVGTPAEFQTALVGLLGQVMGGAAGG